MATFNSEEYAWADLNIAFLGRIITGARGIKIKATQQKTNIYARGNKPHSRTRGNIEFEGELKLLQSEVEALIAQFGDVLSIKPFDVIVNFAPEGGTIKTHVAKAVEFTELEMGMEQNAEFMDLTLPIIIGDVEYNI